MVWDSRGLEIEGLGTRTAHQRSEGPAAPEGRRVAGSLARAGSPAGGSWARDLGLERLHRPAQRGPAAPVGQGAVGCSEGVSSSVGLAGVSASSKSSSPRS